MAQLLRQAGHTVVPHADAAEVVVLNTCTITHRADADARRAVRRLTRQGARVVVTGCFVDADAARAAALPGVSAVIGNADKARIVEAVAHATHSPASATVHEPAPSEHGPSDSEPSDTARFVSVTALRRRMPVTPLPAAAGFRARALLKIQDGCNYGCAFCIVPSVRGGSRSLPMPDVLQRLDALVADGAPEVVLTGVHLGTWGRDLDPRVSVSDLVAAAVPRLGPARLRLSSIDPHEVDDRLIALLANNRDTLCPHLHLPVQSADDDTLRRMRRGHDCSHFVDAVTRACAALGRPAIGTDVIVGFPGEDRAAFERTAEQLAALPLTYLHVFSYSSRAGTAAASMPDPIAPDEIGRRNRVLRQISDDKAAAFRSAHAGQTVDAVVYRRGGATRWPALTDDYLEVDLAPEIGESLAGRRVRLRLDDNGRRATPVQS